MTPELPRDTIAYMELWIGALDAVVLKNLLRHEPLTEQSIAAMSKEEKARLLCL